MNISIIAALDKNNLIGANGHLPWHLPADFAHFKRLTVGKPMIMGRKTYESIGTVLPDRHHFIISRRKRIFTDHCTTFNSITAALNAVKNAKEIMVIGGTSIFKATLPLANTMYLTHIHHAFKGDTYFPCFGQEWIAVQREDFFEPLFYSFITYRRAVAHA